MEETKVKISNGKEYTIKEVKYKDMVANASSDTSSSAKFLIQASSGITEEEYNELGMKDGILLQKIVNEVNGLTQDFLHEAPQKIE